MPATPLVVLLFIIMSLTGCNPTRQAKVKTEPIFKNDHQILSRQVLMYIKDSRDFHYAEAQMFYKQDSEISRFGFWLTSGKENKYQFWISEIVKRKQGFMESWKVYFTGTGESRNFNQHAMPIDAPWFNEFRGIALTHEPVRDAENPQPQRRSQNQSLLQKNHSQIGQTINMLTQLPNEVRAFGDNGKLVFLNIK